MNIGPYDGAWRACLRYRRGAAQECAPCGALPARSLKTAVDGVFSGMKPVFSGAVEAVRSVFTAPFLYYD